MMHLLVYDNVTVYFTICNSFLFFFLSACDAPLGMEDGRIHDGQLLSKGGADGFDAKDSRIGNGKGWCSDQEDVTNSTYRDSIYLQVDLFDVHKITKLNITGGKGYKEYVPGTFAKLSYRVDQNSEYIDYKVCCHLFFHSDYTVSSMNKYLTT